MICKMCMFLEENRSDQLELSYYATSSRFNDLKSRKHDIGPKHFFKQLNRPSPVIFMQVDHHMQNSKNQSSDLKKT